jgi:DNA polymerase
MSQSSAALSPEAAARALLWLADMGADEQVAESPINRFQEKQMAAPAAVEAAPEARHLPPRPLLAGATPPAPRPAPPPGPGAEISFEEIMAGARAAESLDVLARLLDGFEAHPLRRSASNTCFIAGAAQPRVLVIADRPRSEEDRAGRILADKHEVLAERMLAAIGLRGLEEADREQVGLMSFLPWRPPGNRPPNELECRLILPFAERAIALIKPVLILGLGALPGQWLAAAPESIQRQRGRWMEVAGIPMITTFHPETLLKSPGSKRLAWHDLLALKAKLDSLP